VAGAGPGVDNWGLQKGAQQRESQESESASGLEQLHRGGARLVAGAGNLVAGQSLAEAPCPEEAFQV